jgi:ABC-type nitrate/sulfonate/bicarbonate transport system substrate-binding protein
VKRFSTARRHLKNAAALCACAGLLAAALPAQAQTPDPAPLKFKWGAPTADYYVLYVAIDQGLFKKAGLDPEFFWFPTGAPLLAGLKSGNIDVFTTGLATVFALGQKIPLTLIGWEVDTAAGEGIVVPANSPLKDVRDIGKAKAIGVAPGTCAQVSLGLAARKAGLRYKQLATVNVPPPLFANAFKGGGIDAGVGWAPYPQALQATGYRAISWDRDLDAQGGVCPSLYGARPAFLKEHPEVGRKLVQVRAEAQALIAKHPQLAIDALSKRLSISKEVAAAVYRSVAPPNSPTLQQEVAAGTRWSLVDPRAGLAAKLATAGDVLHEAGSIPAPLSSEQIGAAIDPSYIKAYLQQARP